MQERLSKSASAVTNFAASASTECFNDKFQCHVSPRDYFISRREQRERRGRIHFESVASDKGGKQWRDDMRAYEAQKWKTLDTNRNLGAHKYERACLNSRSIARRSVSGFKINVSRWISSMLGNWMRPRDGNKICSFNLISFHFV